MLKNQLEKLKKILSIIAPAFRKTVQFLAPWPGKIFGSFSFGWVAPGWLTRAWTKSKSWVLAHRWLTVGILLGTAGVGTGGYYGYEWYSNLPQPDYVRIEVSGPSSPSKDFPEKHPAVQFRFSSSVANIKSKKEIDPNLISISPKIAGYWKWVNNGSIEFTPTEAWKVAEQYEVYFQPKLFSPDSKFKDYEVEFKTQEFKFDIVKSEFYQNPENRKEKRAIVHVGFSHPVDPESFKDEVSMKMSGSLRKIPVDVSFGKNNFEAYLKSEIIPMPEKDTEIEVKIDRDFQAAGSSSSPNKSSEAKILVPGRKTFFKVDSAEITLIPNEKLDTDQVLSIVLTDEVSEPEFRKSLKVLALPFKKNEDGEIEEYTHPSSITPEQMKQAKEVELELIPNERDASKIFSFKFQEPVKKTLLIQIQKGLRSAGEYEMALGFSDVRTVPEFPPLLQIQQNGGLLSMGGEKKLGIAVRGVSKYRVKLSRVKSDDVVHLITQTYGDFTKPYFQASYNFNYENISETFQEDFTVDIPPGDPTEGGRLQYRALDLSKYIHSKHGTRGIFHVELLKLDDDSRNPQRMDARLLQISDLGIVAKANSDGSRDVFVQSIRTGNPVVGARVDVIGKNGLSVFSMTTSESGRASFPGFQGLKNEKFPVGFVVHQGEDMSFLTTDPRDRRINLHRFDTGGETNATSKNALRAYLFSDRGIYRPGEEMKLAYIVKSESWSALHGGVPVETLIRDPRGVAVFKERIKLAASGFSAFSFKTQESSPTGRYEVEMSLIEEEKGSDPSGKKKKKKKESKTLLGSTSVRVEEFLPDTLKIQSSLSQTGKKHEGWVQPSGLKGWVGLRNLYGIAAVGNRIAGSFTLTPAFPTVPAFRDYVFFNPGKNEKSYVEKLGDLSTDSKGEVEFPIDLSKFDEGTYRLAFTAEGFSTEGGRSVMTRSTTLVSPLAYILGYKSSSHLDYLKLKADASVHILALGPDLTPTDLDGMTVKVEEVRMVSVLSKDTDGVYRYQSSKKIIPVSKSKAKILGSGLKIDLKTDQAGTFQVVLQKSDNREDLKIEYTVIGENNVLARLEKNSELQIKLAKSDFEPGEEIEMQITAPYVGAGLITIEREKTHATKWFKTSATSTVQRIRVPNDLDGNAYVHVNFIRDASSHEIFTSPLSYGVVPFSVSKKRRMISVDLKSPELVKPGEKVTVKYKASQASQLILFGVDEGILQVAAYKKPDPLSYFFVKKQLGVTTTQILDLILPEYSVLKAASAAGGGEGMGAGKGMNPFRRKTDLPVVFWSGVVSAGPEAKSFSYTVPEYFNGQIRIYAVAASAAAVGVGEASTWVRGDLILSPVAPLFAMPGDEFDVSVPVGNQIKGSGKATKIKVSVHGTNGLEVVGPSEKEIEVEEERQGVAHFRMKALNRLGIGKIEFKASHGNKGAKVTQELSLLPSAPFETQVQVGFVDGQEKEVSLSRKLYVEFASKSVAVSGQPIGLVHGMARYLAGYAFDCTEQLISRAMSAMLLKNHPDFKTWSDENTKTFEKIKAEVRSRESSGGGMQPFARSGSVNEFYTAYALHFLQVAKEKGQNFGTDLQGRLVNYLKNRFFERAPTSMKQARLMAYELYVLARSGHVLNAELVDLNDVLEKAGSESEMKNWKKDLTSLFMAATYQLYKQDAKAAELFGRYNPFKKEKLEAFETGDYWDLTAAQGVTLEMVAQVFPSKLSDLDPKWMLALAKGIEKQTYTTFGSAYMVLGLDEVSRRVVKEGSLASAEVQQKLGTKWEPVTLKGDQVRSGTVDLAAIAGKVKRSSDLPVFYQWVESGYDSAPSTTLVKKGIEIDHFLTDADGSRVSKAKMGETYTAHLRLRGIDQDLSDLVAVARFPAGFQVVLSGTGANAPAVGGSESGSEPEYSPAVEGEGEGRYEEGASYRMPGGLGIFGIASAYADEPQFQSFSPVYTDSREDRLILYGSVGRVIEEFTYQLKAVSSGSFQFPASTVEHMYRREVYGRTEATKIEVLPAK
ncbi:MAG: alpha-2-macroglobulin family protein [Bdellovibrionales bacterium]|nr:alpha-2-macroglobulin family protein [Bdellovibrionales bacterium]